MEYKLFEIDFSGWSGAFQFECDNVAVPVEEEVVYVSDSYADHDSFGFYIGDCDHAFDHAKSMVYEILECGRESRFLWDYRQKLAEDVKHYLECCFTWEEDMADGAVTLIKYMVLLNMEEELYPLLKNYYRDYIKDREEEEQYTIPLDFRYLYIAIGDKALFERADSRLAMMYYGLASLEWDRNHKEPVGKSGNPKDKINWEDVRNWPQMYDTYRRIHTGTTAFREDYYELKEERIYWDRFVDLLGRLDKWEEETTIVELSDGFFQLAESLLNRASKTPNHHLMRTVLLAAHHIYAGCLLSALYCLQQENGQVQARYGQKALAGLKKADNTRLTVLKQYVDICQRQQSCLKDLLLLARETMCVARVQRMLLVGPEEDGQEIAYYTALPTLCYLLPGVKEDNEFCGQMSVMNIAYMNDPNEGKILQRYLGMGRPTAQQEPGRRKATYPYVFMKCFTSLVDDLPMWEMYGDHARGCCIILDRKCFVSKAGARKAVPLYRICYLKKNGTSVSMNREDNPYLRDMDGMRRLLREIRKGIRLAAGNPFLYRWLENILEDIVYLFKDAAYRHEQEVRILYRFNEADKCFCHTPGEYPLLFVRPEFTMDIKEIITGPKFEKLSERMPYLTEQVEKMCRTTGRTMPGITMSSIEYR